MRNAAVAAALFAWFPFAAAAQAPAQPSQWVDTPAPQAAPPPQSAPPAQPPPPPQYAPPPQYPPPPQYAPPPQYPPTAYPPPMGPIQQRGSWYIGFGLGGGDGSVNLPAGPINSSGGSTSFRNYLGMSPTTVGINLKLGATLTPRLLLGGDITAIRSAGSQDGVDASLQITNYLAMVTFFPWEKGFFLRGGLGFSKFNYDVTGGFSASNSETGSAVQVGLGYAWWLGKAFNLTANLDFAGQSYGNSSSDPYGALPKSSSFWALGVGFDWY